LAQPAELNRAPSKHPTHSRWRDHAALPIGTLTFLLTNIEGSTWMWQAAGDAMQIALARHDVSASGITTRGRP
jgi:hypothetical protein